MAKTRPQYQRLSEKELHRQAAIREIKIARYRKELDDQIAQIALGKIKSKREELAEQSQEIS